MTDGKKLAQAWNDWLESTEGKNCADPLTLKLSAADRQYLKNRLCRAFMAGAKAGAPTSETKP